MKRINGQEISSRIYNELEKLRNNKTLGIILASNDEPSKKYVSLKIAKCKDLGVNVNLFEPNLTESDLLAQIKTKIEIWNKDENIAGILVQLPLTESLKIHKREILDLIDPKKDVDGLTSFNLHSIKENKHYFLPATVSAVIKSLEFVAKDLNLSFNEYLKDKNIVIINNSDLIGKPLNYFLSKYTKVTNLDEDTEDIKAHTFEADIVISATGVGELFNSDYFKEGVVLIDITSIKKGSQVCGDFIYSTELENKASYLTPVPGGIGPLTIASLIENLFKS